MIRKWAWVCALAAGCAAGAVARAADAGHGLRVMEGQARAVLQDRAIRLELPFAAPSSGNARVTAWMLSPKDVRSEESSADVHAGQSKVEILLGQPRDEHGNPVEDIGWYRIGYRLEFDGGAAAQGILAVGAIARNLMALRLARPISLLPDSPIVLRIFAGNPVTLQPTRGARIKVELDIEDEAKESDPSPIAREGVTGADGEMSVVFASGLKRGQKASVKVDGVYAAADGVARAHLDSELEAPDGASFHTETDKPLHKPGETVHLRTLLLDVRRHAVANQPVTLTIKDPDNKTVEEVGLKTNRFGIASYDWKTKPQTATGDFDADFAMDGDDSTSAEDESTALRIARYELPEFKVIATPERGFYVAGEEAAVTVHAEYLFGKPVAAGEVKVLRVDDDEEPQTKDKKPAEAQDKLDANGNARLTLDVNENINQLKTRRFERYEDVGFRALVTDATTGRTELRNFTVRVTLNPVHIYTTSLGGDDRESDLLVLTSYADGRPASCRVTLEWLDEKRNATRAAVATTNRYGVAKVHVQIPAWMGANQYSSDGNMRLTARDSEGKISTYDDNYYSGGQSGLWIDVGRSLLRPGEAIEAEVHGTPGSLVDVDAMSGGNLLVHTTVRLTHRMEPMEIAADAGFKGEVTLYAYTLNRDIGEYERYGGGAASRTVLYPQHRALRVKLSGIHESYAPGGEVAGNVRVTNAAGGPVSSALGLAVFDSAVEERARTDEDENQRWFSTPWWQDQDQVAGMTRADLDAVDTSEPVPEELQTVAELLLNNQAENGVAIEGSSDEEARGLYEAGMTNSLRALGKAVEAVTEPRLPNTYAAIREVGRAAKLEDGVLLDPWGEPYRVDVNTEATYEEIFLISGGPDKRFGTSDDFRIELARRGWFDVPGKRLEAILRKTSEAGRPLPADANALKAIAAAAGLDLDSDAQGARAPDGKPYTYRIEVDRRYYRVLVVRDAGPAQEGTEVWRSEPIDYFAQAEVQMDNALRMWTNAAKPFPTTEADALAAFAAANLGPGALEDPLGRPLTVRTTEVMAYTQVEHIKAGESLETKTTFVTRQFRAVQILCPPAGEEPQPAIIAEFLNASMEQSGSDAKPRPVKGETFLRYTGAIGGTITDQTGAVIPGAVVRVTGPGFEKTATSDAQGVYLVPNLQPGFYRVSVDAKGFMAFSLVEVRVTAEAITTVDVTLRVGAMTETVEVSASANVLNTLSAEQISSIPNGVKGTKGAKGTGKPEQNFTPRVRHVFDETAYWAPMLETDANGRAAFRFHLPDSLTTWKLHALTSTVDGRIAPLDHTFRTFQPFFVDLDSPQVLTEGDEIALPVNLRNYTARELRLPVTLTKATWFQALSAESQPGVIAAGATVPVSFRLRAVTRTEQGALRITAANASEGDSVEKTIRVHPDGRPRTASASGLLRGKSPRLSVDLPADVIAGSQHGELLLYPNLGSQVLHAIEASLERPYGCGEQTISSTWPSLLFLELLKSSGAASPRQEQAQAYLQLGYDRLQDYFAQDGGLTYWGGNDHDPDAALTAYGIRFLLAARPYVHVDDARILAAVRWLAAAQQADGNWKPHYGDPTAEVALTAAQALDAAAADDQLFSSAPKDERDRVRAAAARAVVWASHSAAAVHDPYANALRLAMAAQAGDQRRIDGLRQELISNLDTDRDGAHWTRNAASPFYGWGRAGDVETTALALTALEAVAHSGADRAALDPVLLWLLRTRDQFGIWYSGQATVRVLEALLPMALEQLNSPSRTVRFAVTVNGADAGTMESDTHLLNAPRSLDVTAWLRPGHNDVALAASETTSLASAEISVEFYTPWSGMASNTATGKTFGLDFNYNCAAGGAMAGQAVDCTVDARRFGSAGYGMLLAEAGLPPGADVDRASLSKLLDDWTISRFELQPDRIVFYLWSGRAEGTHFQFRFTPRYAIRAKAAPSTLSDYYNPDLKVVLAPQTFDVVSPTPQASTTLGAAGGSGW